jgi:hypothetical protein
VSVARDYGSEKEGRKEVRVWDTLCVLFKGNEEMRDVGGGKP